MLAGGTKKIERWLSYSGGCFPNLCDKDALDCTAASISTPKPLTIDLGTSDNGT